jgi:hypothetical protein
MVRIHFPPAESLVRTDFRWPRLSPSSPRSCAEVRRRASPCATPRPSSTGKPWARQWSRNSAHSRDLPVPASAMIPKTCPPSPARSRAASSSVMSRSRPTKAERPRARERSRRVRNVPAPSRSNTPTGSTTPLPGGGRDRGVGNSLRPAGRSVRTDRCGRGSASASMRCARPTSSDSWFSRRAKPSPEPRSRLAHKPVPQRYRGWCNPAVGSSRRC